MTTSHGSSTAKKLITVPAACRKSLPKERRASFTGALLGDVDPLRQRRDLIVSRSVSMRRRRFARCVPNESSCDCTVASSFDTVMSCSILMSLFFMNSVSRSRCSVMQRELSLGSRRPAPPGPRRWCFGR